MLIAWAGIYGAFSAQKVEKHLAAVAMYLAAAHRKANSVHSKLQGLVKSATLLYGRKSSAGAAASAAAAADDDDAAAASVAAEADTSPEAKARRAASRLLQNVNTGGTGSHGSQVAALPDALVIDLVEYDSCWLKYLFAMHEKFVDEEGSDGGIDASGGVGGKKAKKGAKSLPGSRYAAAAVTGGGETFSRSHGGPHRQAGHDEHTAHSRLQASKKRMEMLVKVADSAGQRARQAELDAAVQNLRRYEDKFEEYLLLEAKEPSAAATSLRAMYEGKMKEAHDYVTKIRLSGGQESVGAPSSAVSSAQPSPLLFGARKLVVQRVELQAARLHGPRVNRLRLVEADELRAQVEQKNGGVENELRLLAHPRQLHGQTEVRALERIVDPLGVL